MARSQRRGPAGRARRARRGQNVPPPFPQILAAFLNEDATTLVTEDGLVLQSE